MKENKKTISIIGLGNIGYALAKNFVTGNRAVFVADRDIQKAQDLGSKLGDLVTPLPMDQAIKKADIIIFSVWFDVIKALFKEYSKELEGKIIIDPSNPIAPDGKGGFIKTIEKDKSSGEILSELRPTGSILVKALGSLGAKSLETKAHDSLAPIVMFYATNDSSTHSTVEDLINDQGFVPVYVGELSESIKIEVFGELHEFGGLGKAITLEEYSQR